ncbi:MAG: PepSY domain-containing protein [Novosphingobium sp.]
MKRLIAIALLAAGPLAAGLPAVSALAAPGDAQGQVRKDIRAGNVRTLREIEQQILPTMQGMQYLGPEYDPTALAYRLKFIRDGRVVFVDVDARTGQVMRQSR